MAGRERNLEAVGRGVGQAVYGVRPEVVILLLFAVGDHWRARRLEPLDRVSNSFLVERFESRVHGVSLRDRVEQTARPRDAPNGLRRDMKAAHRGLCGP